MEGCGNPYNLPDGFVVPAGGSPEEHRSAAARYAEALVAALRPLLPVLDGHVNQFYTLRTHEAEPLASWIGELRDLCAGGGAAALFDPAPGAPEGTLLSFMQRVKDLTMPRRQRGVAMWGDNSGPPPPLPEQVRRFAKPKKVHEMEHLAHEIRVAASRVGAEQVVDIGAGAGRLARCLASQGDLHVVVVDCQADLLERGEEQDQRIIARANNGVVEAGRVRRVHATVGPESGQGVLKEEVSRPALACGLHMCGELTPCALRFFRDAGLPIRALLAVGCCYQHETSFPMSEAVRGVWGQGEGPSATAKLAAARCVSAQFMGRATPEQRRRIAEGRIARALLEQEMHRLGVRAPGGEGAEGSGGGEGSGERLVVKAPFRPKDESFSGYVLRTLRVVGVDEGRLPPAGALDAEFKRAMEEDRAVLTGMYVVREALAALLEALLVVDRALYLAEGARVGAVAVVPAFDPGVSARNLLLLATEAGAGGGAQSAA